ncbi:MAG: M20/M25/M40 family metallo-hydrolase [Acidobacteria bacterium]|nr:MAG: M20/M25/M40 family metallo-hydrolase [Acidobacteriota bacterium]
MRMIRLLVAVLAAGLMLPAAAQQLTQAQVDGQARALETPANSKIMWIMHELADVYGPRLTGGPNLLRADRWVVRTTTSWGMKNAHLEPYPFVPERLHHAVPGWANRLLQANAIAPFQDQLVVRSLHWTPGTPGPVTAQAVLIPDPPGLSRGSFENGRFLPAPQPTQAELDAYFAKYAPVVRDKIVLVGEYKMVPVSFTPWELRRSDTQWDCMLGVLAPDTAACKPYQRPRFRRFPQPAPQAGRLNYREVSAQLDAFLLKNGVKVRINDAHKAHGVIVAYNNPSYDISTAVPTVVMQSDSYGRISRLLGDDIPVTLRFDIRNVTYPEGRRFNDVVAEIPGTDLKAQVVMLGGHLDSWNNATGATDNAAGSAMMLEAARILLAMHAHPRRTIRVALWGGEEEGLLGSLAYVDAHFGSFEHPTPEYKNLVAYLNIDDGTSKPRGARVFGPPAAAAFFRQTLAPFHDWGFMGAVADSSRRTGGTDSTSFNQAGLPGVNFEQDPIEYQPYSWHTNLDTYERLVPQDLREGAAEIAAAAYALAMAPEPLPRFEAAKMPKPPKPVDPSPQAALRSGQKN